MSQMQQEAAAMHACVGRGKNAVAVAFPSICPPAKVEREKCQSGLSMARTRKYKLSRNTEFTSKLLTINLIPCPLIAFRDIS